MTVKPPETDWSAWNNWCDSRIDARRDFDREVLVEVIAELKSMIEDQDEKLKVQAENLHNLEVKLAELMGANNALAADHRAAIRESRHAVGVDQVNTFEPTRLLQRRKIN